LVLCWESAEVGGDVAVGSEEGEHLEINKAYALVQVIRLLAYREERP
jgi:hypothetical protein